MAYCCRCGVYAALDDAKMCGTCRAAWRPSAPAAADLGTRTQRQPVSGGARIPSGKRQQVHLDP